MPIGELLEKKFKKMDIFKQLHEEHKEKLKQFYENKRDEEYKEKQDILEEVERIRRNY